MKNTTRARYTAAANVLCQYIFTSLYLFALCLVANLLTGLNFNINTVEEDVHLASHHNIIVRHKNSHVLQSY